MRISAKARYGLAAMVYFSMRYPEQRKFTVLEISETLKISKIYLEQVFTQLKLAGIIHATKGPQGGYSLSRLPSETTAYDVLYATETSLFDPTPSTVAESAPHIEQAVTQTVYAALDGSVKDRLLKITLRDLAEEAIQNTASGYMYYL